MDMTIYKKGATYTADCNKCGCTLYTHEWAHADHNDRRDAMQSGTLQCDQCPTGTADPETFRYEGRQYAGQYSMPGYLDRTELHYGANYRALCRELREMYE